MLVLSRKPMECMLIGDHVVITSLAIQGSRVRMGIDAPKEISVLRSELEILPTEMATPTNITSIK